MRPVEIKKDIHWVGAVDYNTRDFHGYALSPNGTTYNAFLIKDEKVTLFDTVKHGHEEEFFENVALAAGGLEAVDYLVVNHLEPDHAGCLVETVERVKPEKIFCSPMGLKAMDSLYHMKDKGWNIEALPTGANLSLGRHTLQFLETRMLHWPDNMMTYIPEAKLLISSDAFGQNLASSERFVDEVDRAKLTELMREYFANIVLPFSPIVQKTFEQIQKLGWEIDMIAPDHGLMFRGKDVAFAIQQYAELAAQHPTRRATILFDTMWHSTEAMARAIGDGLKDAGCEVTLMHLKANHHTSVMTEISRSGAVIVGSPTHNNGILPYVAGALQYIKGLKPQNKVGGVFGSFGWSGESVKIIKEWLTSMNIDVVGEGVRTKNVPDAEVLAQCFDYGRQIALAIEAKMEACGVK
jgi:flavorubredoxin